MNLENKYPDVEGFNSQNIKELKDLFIRIKDKYHLDSSELLNRLEEKEILIPASIFSKKLSSLETIVKYLKENLGLESKAIAELTKRDVKTIYQAYSSAKEKVGKKFVVKESKYYIPAAILSERKLGVLENIVKYLREESGLNYSEIGRLLGRDPRTIWTVYSRSVKK